MPCRSDFDNDYDVFLCFNNEGNFLHWPHPGRGARRYLWTNSKSADCTIDAVPRQRQSPCRHSERSGALRSVGGSIHRVYALSSPHGCGE